MMRLIRRLFLFLCLFLTGFVIWAGFHARKNGFSESWRNAIEDEFANRGYYVEIGKITLGAFRGLVAEDIHFFRSADKIFEIASVDDVYLDVDLSKILNKEISINTLDVADASLSLPVDPSDPSGKKLKVENLSGRVVITESVIEIVSAEASVANVELNLAGRLLRLPMDERTLTEEENERNSEQLAARRYQISRVIEELERYEFLDEPAMIAVEFRGDLEDLSTMTARVEVESGQLSKKEESEYYVDGLSAVFRFDGQSHEAEIESLSIRDEQGEISLTGRWDQDENLIEFEMVSNADISSLVGFFWNDRKLGEVVFFNPPEIEMKGKLNLNELGRATWSFPGSVIGQFKSDRFVTRGTVFSGLDFGFSAEGERAYLRNLRLDHKSGVAFANFKYEPGNGVKSIQYHTEIKLDPEAFRPFFDEGGRKFLDSWGFSENSAVYLAAVGEGENWDLKTWINKGVVDLRNFQLKGVEFREMEADFEAKSGQLWLNDIVLGRSEGEIVAEMVHYMPEQSQWEVKGVVSTVDLVKGARAFNPKLSKYLERYRFNSHPTVKLAGLLDSRREEEVREKPRNNQLAVSFSCDDSAEYEFLGKVVPLSSPSGELEISGSRVHLTNLSAGIFDGSIEVEYDALNVRSEDKPYDASVRVSRVPLEDVTRLYGGVEVATGRVDAVFHLSGRGGDVSKLNGHGAASIEDGELFALPLMGALAGFLQVSPSNGGVAREAQATFQIENGVLQTDDFVALADNVFVGSAGTISFVDQSVDLEAVVNPKGALSRTILTPVSELLTFSCSGTLQEPVWSAKHISNIGKLPSQVITEMTQVPFEGLKALGGGLFKPQATESYQGSDRSASPVLSPSEGLRSIGKGIFGPQKKRIERAGTESDQERQVILPGLKGSQSQKSQD
ncbi:MAG: hypothetical protein CMO47_01475 [Verrucomicrobiales bacterium]|mgnify:FL=1|nr:hypothetical protein [Verrucomicrobiales bacterium]